MIGTSTSTTGGGSSLTLHTRNAAFSVVVIALFAAAPRFSPAAAREPYIPDTLIFADSSEREGRIVSIDGADIQFQEDPRGRTKLIPLAEVRRIVWASGGESLHPVVQDPLSGEIPGFRRARSSARFRRDDLELSRGEVAYNAFGRGVMVGAVATFFTSDGDEKKVAFAAGFLLQFGISFFAGW